MRGVFAPARNRVLTLATHKKNSRASDRRRWSGAGHDPTKCQIGLDRLSEFDRPGGFLSPARNRPARFLQRGALPDFGCTAAVRHAPLTARAEKCGDLVVHVPTECVALIDNVLPDNGAVFAVIERSVDAAEDAGHYR